MQLEGYSGQLESLIPKLEAVLPSTEVICLSGKAPCGMGKNLTIVINQLTHEQAVKVEECLLSNDISYVGYYGDECFYSIGREHSDWYYLTGEQDEPSVENQKLKH